MVVAVHVAPTDASDRQSQAQSTTARAPHSPPATTNAETPAAATSASPDKHAQTWQSPAQGLWLLVVALAGVIVVSAGMVANDCREEYRAAPSPSAREAALRSTVYCLTVLISILSFFVYWCFRCLWPVRPEDAEWLLGQLSGSMMGLAVVLLLTATRIGGGSSQCSDLGGGFANLAFGAAVFLALVFCVAAFVVSYARDTAKPLLFTVAAAYRGGSVNRVHVTV